jgi:gamma-glutamylcyclotransferase (GGCT)/AIG2-like uncharacterized protein YtfP
LDRLPLFAYGTLRDADMLTAVLGRVLKPAQVMPASVPGYRAVTMPGRVYPGLVRRAGAEAPGLLIRGVMRQEYDLLDAYEGEEYRRERIMVMAEGRPYSAAVYLPMAEIGAGAEPWSLETWAQLHKTAAMTKETGIANALRQRTGED